MGDQIGKVFDFIKTVAPPFAKLLPLLIFNPIFMFQTHYNYILLISGEFKDLGEGRESYIIDDRIWKEIGSATATANNTIPSAFGRRIPNVAKDRTYMTAEAHVVWGTEHDHAIRRAIHEACRVGIEG